MHLWAERGGHDLVALYSESESAWSRRGRDGKMRESAEARATFSSMVAEFAVLKPEVVICDTLDRFTRTLREGLNLLELLRGHGVGLLPLDIDRERPLNIDDDADWGIVTRAFLDAEGENRSRARRAKRSYEGRRARGAPMRNIAPFGLQRDGDRYVPNRDAHVITALDEKYLTGMPLPDIHAWLRSVAPHAWTSRNGVRHALRSVDYVAANVRTPEVAQRIRSRMDSRRTHHGARRKHPHEFTGVFACGRCVALGFEPGDALMGEALKRGRDGELRPTLVCQGASLLQKRHKEFTVSVSRISNAWSSMTHNLAADSGAVQRWAQDESASAGVAKRRHLERSLAKLEREEVGIATRRANALRFLSDAAAGVVNQARRALLEIEADEAELAMRRDFLRRDLAALTNLPRSADELRTALAAYHAHYLTFATDRQNELSRALCGAIGGYPMLNRSGDHRWAPIVCSWPAALVEPFEIAPPRGSTGDYDRKRRARRLDAGKCSRCGARPFKVGASPKTGRPYVTCESCLSKDVAGHQRRKNAAGALFPA